MDHTNNLNVEDIWVLLHYHFESERLKGIQNKLEIVQTVNDLFVRY